MNSALDGFLVMEAGESLATAYAGRLLALLGADVVRVRSMDDPSTAETRTNTAGDVQEALLTFLNAGKRSVTIDPAMTEDDGTVGCLLEQADILIEDAGASALSGFGLGAGAGRGSTARQKPLAVVHVSDFGPEEHAQQPATELTIQARAGWVVPRTMPDTVPVMVGGRAVEYVTGVDAAVAALTASLEARRGNHDVHADVTRLEATHATLPYPTLYESTLRELGWGSVRGQYRPLGVLPCRDGWVGINVLTAQQWEDACLLLGVPEYIDAWAELKQGGPRLSDFRGKVATWLADWPAVQVVDLCQAMRIPAVPVASGDSLPRLAQWSEREFFERTSAPEGAFIHPGPPWRLSGTPALRLDPKPRPVADGEAVHGLTRDEVGLRQGRDDDASSTVGSPLRGLRVLDLATFWAGSYLGSFLGGFGADVIKVESIQRPDGFRYGKTFQELGEDWYERSLVWQATNLDKRGITLDLTRNAGRELLARLVADADVLVENYSVRVIESFGFGWEDLRAMNPNIIMVRLPGFGLEGPWRDYVGWGNVFEQVGGMAWTTGHADGPPATPGGYADPIVGMHGAVALLAALEHRDRVGHGQLIEVSQIEVVAQLTAEQVIAASLMGVAPGRTGNRTQDTAPQGVYPTREPGSWIAMSVRDNADWGRLQSAMSSPEWAWDVRYADIEGRRRAAEELDHRIGAWVKQLTVDEALGRLREEGVPCGPVNLDPVAFVEDSVLRSRSFFSPVAHPITGMHDYPDFPVRLSTRPPALARRPAPTLGQHNWEVLGDELGLDQAELQQLMEDRVIGTRPLGL